MLVCLILFLFFFIFVYYFNSTAVNHPKDDIKNNLLSFNDYVLSTDEINLYKKSGSNYKKVGKAGKNVVLHINQDGKYYKLVDLDDDYYIDGSNIKNTDEVDQKNDSRYKNYLVFNNNIKTNNQTTFYDDQGNLVYQFNKEYSLPIIINEKGNYGVEFLGKLLYIHDGEVIENKNTENKNTLGVGVLNYHFFYDETDSEEQSKCNQDICTSKNQFQAHLNYIKENNYFTLTMKELEMYIDGRIQLPKSVVITIDDGWRAELGVKMLNDNKLNGTLFLITSLYNSQNYSSDYVEVHSHSDNMHNTGVCPSGQGGGIQCLDESTILNDLKISSDKLNGSKVFCYPFYEYNDYSISMLKKAGFVMAFAGETSRSDNMVHVGSNKYNLPRFVVVNYTSMVDFKNYLEGSYLS